MILFELLRLKGKGTSSDGEGDLNPEHGLVSRLRVSTPIELSFHTSPEIICWETLFWFPFCVKTDSRAGLVMGWVESCPCVGCSKFRL